MEAEVLTALGLAEDTDVAAVLTAITALHTERDEATAKAAELEAAKPETKTLDQLADAEGKVVLDSAQVADMVRKADLGEKAHKELEQARFATTFERACREGRAIPAQLDRFTELHGEAPALALKMLDEGPKIVNTEPSAWDNTRKTDGGDAPAGVDPESHKLDQKVRTKLRELQKPLSEYAQVAEQMMLDGEL